MFVTAIILVFLFDSSKEILQVFKWDPFTIFVIGGGFAIIVIIFELILEKVFQKKCLMMVE
ncbi:hypothetical protein KHA80_01625 [Anaerobacillus sp. HL2]|nr:hypothetical protein KHA80_01625 [Anaerobacillus sp. HL2]